MPQSSFPRPLRWYEDLAIFFLSRSPRIDRILIEQRVSDEDSPEDEPLDDSHTYNDTVHYLESMYEAPSATFSDEV